MKPQIDASNKRYANGCKAKRNQEATKPETKSNQETTKHEPNENVNENVKEKKKYIRVHLRRYGPHTQEKAFASVYWASIAGATL